MSSEANFQSSRELELKTVFLESEFCDFPLESKPINRINLENIK